MHLAVGKPQSHSGSAGAPKRTREEVLPVQQAEASGLSVGATTETNSRKLRGERSFHLLPAGGTVIGGLAV